MRGWATRGGLSSLCPYPLPGVRHLPVFSCLLPSCRQGCFSAATAPACSLRLSVIFLAPLGECAPRPPPSPPRYQGNHASMQLRCASAPSPLRPSRSHPIPHQALSYNPTAEPPLQPTTSAWRSRCPSRSTDRQTCCLQVFPMVFSSWVCFYAIPSSCFSFFSSCATLIQPLRVIRANAAAQGRQGRRQGVRAQLPCSMADVR